MQTTVSMTGIHCESCSKLIKTVSVDFPAITNVDVNLKTKTATITHADDFPFENWKSEIEALGPDYAVKTL